MQPNKADSICLLSPPLVANHFQVYSTTNILILPSFHIENPSSFESVLRNYLYKRSHSIVIVILQPM